MANALYDKGRQAFAEGKIDWLTHTIRCFLLTSAYTPNLATHEFLSSVPPGSRLGPPSSPLTSKTTTAGVCDAADAFFNSVPAGTAVYVLIYKDTGAEPTSNLIALIDTATGLPLVTDNDTVIVQWDNGANRIFKL